MSDQDELLELIHRYADGIADEGETLQLQSLLKDDPQARHLFLTYMELDAALANLSDATVLCGSELPTVSPDLAGRSAPDPLNGQPPEIQQLIQQPILRRWTSTRTRLISITALVLACSLMAVLGRWAALAPPSDLGTSIDSHFGIWGAITDVGSGVTIVRDRQSRPAREGDALRTNERIVISENGMAEVSVAGLGVVSLGPEARLCSGTEPHLIKLNAGFAAINAEKQAAGQPWRIRTPQVEAAVLGTKFNIASMKGRTSLRVAEGMVRLTNLIGGQSQHVRGGCRAIVKDDASFQIAASRPGSVLLITSREPPNERWDQFNQILIDKLVQARMWRLGFRVEVQHYESSDAIDLTNRSLVILSLFDYGVGERVIERLGLAKLDLPVLCLEPAAYPVLGMTAEGEGIGFGFREGASPVEFLQPLHPLSGGYSGLHHHLIRGQIGWGRPENGAAEIAVLPGRPKQAVLFGYDTDQPMSAFPAPARRVGLFLDPTGISEASKETWDIFEAAVDWCVATEATL